MVCSDAVTLDLAGAGRLVQPLGVAVLTHGQRDLHVHLDEVARGLHLVAYGVAVSAVRRDEAHQRDHARGGVQLRNLACAGVNQSTVRRWAVGKLSVVPGRRLPVPDPQQPPELPLEKGDPLSIFLSGCTGDGLHQCRIHPVHNYAPSSSVRR
jgi:hypothetical protein